jgi:hypothetical protein
MRSKFSLVGLKIVKMDTRLQAAVPVQERLAVTLRFLATGNLYTVCNIFSKFIVSQVVTEVCQAMFETLKENIQVKRLCIAQSKLFCT